MLETLSNADLFEVTVAAPGEVETSDAPGEPWYATPNDGAKANAILRERGVW